MLTVVIVIHALSTLMMAGLGWFVQLVHYPLFAHVGEKNFGRFEKEHVRRTTWIVAPLMTAEAATAIGLVFFLWGRQYRGLTLLGLLLLVVIWASAAFIQVPCHKKLDKGLDLPTAHRLVRTNWIRTAAWTARGVLAILILQAIQP
jgi:hypothetical protein